VPKTTPFEKKYLRTRERVLANQQELDRQTKRFKTLIVIQSTIQKTLGFLFIPK
jgi:hypothetical protein